MCLFLFIYLFLRRCEHDAAYDRGEGRLEAAGGDHAGRGDDDHQDLHHGAHHQHHLHRGGGVQRGHGGRASLHGTARTSHTHAEELVHGEHAAVQITSICFIWLFIIFGPTAYLGHSLWSLRAHYAALRSLHTL